MNRLFKMAVTAGVENAVRLHIERGDDVDSRDDNGLTPLMIAAARNKAGICRLLLASKADPTLLDPLGRDALTIAQSANATDAVAVLQTAIAQPPTELDLLADYPGVVTVTEPVLVGGSDWEPEAEETRPLLDESLAQPAATLQTRISLHAPIDSSASWDEFDIALPSFAEPMNREEPPASHEEIRLLFLRALREGSVPLERLEELADASDSELQALRLLVNELGAEVDERFEYPGDFEDFTVDVNPDASGEEDEAVRAALEALDAISADAHSPLRNFLAEAQKHPLLSASEELILGQSMETQIEQALDALAGWPAGVARVLDLAAQAGADQINLSWMASEPGDEAPADEASLEAEPEVVSQADIEEEAEEVSERAFSDISGRFAALAAAPRAEGREAEGWAERREILGAISFRPAFLVELAELAGPDHQCARNYARAIEKFRRARDRLAVANLRLAVSIARKYQHSGIPLSDLIQDANIGLLRAVDKFDWRKGFRFATYATWWIRQSVSRAVADTSRCIRLPAHAHAMAYKAEQAVRIWEERDGRPPSAAELADELGVSLRKVQALLRAGEEPASLEDILERDAAGADLAEAFELPDPAEALEAKELREQLNLALSAFKPSESRVIRMRFGFGLDDVMTLEEVGRAFGVTRERIRQIESKALGRLRHPARREALSAWAPQDDEEAQTVAEPPANAGKRGEGAIDEPDAPNVPREAKSLTHLRAPRGGLPSRAAPLTPKSGSSNAIERLLVEAAAMGVTVEDGRDGPTGQLWVRIQSATDRRTRGLIRKLYGLGFSFAPGAGFWR